VIESGTKYLSGKGDVLLGAVVFRKKQGCSSFLSINALLRLTSRRVVV
jgi:cystathionine beta-lyase/cystathionine gamma-synthase